MAVITYVVVQYVFAGGRVGDTLVFNRLVGVRENMS